MLQGPYTLPGFLYPQPRYDFKSNTDAPEVEPGANVFVFTELVRLTASLAPRLVCQTGFNYGASAVAFLCNTGVDATVYSFDLGEHRYLQIGWELIDLRFGERHGLVFGDSSQTLAQARGAAPFAYNENLPKSRCDLAYVDGGHSFEAAYGDIANFRVLSRPNATVVVDDCHYPIDVDTTNHWEGVPRAYAAAVEDGIIIHERQFATNACNGYWNSRFCSRLCIGRFSG